MSALQKSLMKKLPPKCPRTDAAKMAPPGRGRSRDYAPVPWQHYFARAEDVQVAGGTFRVYLSAEPDEPTRPRIVALHGGGYSGLSWSLFTEEITSMVHCQVVCIDLRGHGHTHTADDDDLSADTLVGDVVQVLEKVLGAETPPLVVAGHSMGGAVAVRLAGSARLQSWLCAVVVIDVVEGTAMDSLASMQSFLRSRPTHFRSIEHAIEWCVRSGQVRNVDSAKVSMPSQIINCSTGRLATCELDNYTPQEADLSPAEHSMAANSIAEESEDGEEHVQQFKKPETDTHVDHKYTWRIDLSKTERFWAGWFEGLSAAFLSARAPRLLLLASIDGLDRDLTVGQMQGKFQMQVLSRCGHAVHEDSPGEVARVVSAFLLRHRLTDTTDGATMDFGSMPGC